MALDDLDKRVLNCTFGNYPWDDWEKKAVAAGVPAGLAGVGRLTMREAYQHSWCKELKVVCGWMDDGQAMIEFALKHPQAAHEFWKRLLQTDGQVINIAHLLCRMLERYEKSRPQL